MKGLLIKDLQIMKMQKNFLLILLIIAVWLTFSMGESSFVVGYLLFMFPTIAFGTLRYDEFDNGNAFLFTLPISRKLYVAEKYLLTFLTEIFSFAVAIIIVLIFGLVKGVSVWDALVDSPIIFALATILFSFMLPIQLKFDSEKGRTVTFIMIGIFVLAGLGFIQLSEMLHIDTNQWVAQFSQLNWGIFVVLVFVLAIIVGLISMKISLSIVNKKEF